MRRFLVGLSVLALFVGVATPARAENSIGMRMAVKALRGVENITLGFVTELPKTVYYDSVTRGVPYGVTIGTLRGVGVGVLRTGVGIYELATFPVPVPNNYKPLLFPEFPTSSEKKPIRLREITNVWMGQGDLCVVQRSSPTEGGAAGQQSQGRGGLPGVL